MHNPFKTSLKAAKPSPMSAPFWRDKRGNVSMMFGLSLLPMLTMVGAAVDYSRSNSYKGALQAALDSATLSAAKLGEGESIRLAAANRYFQAMLPPGGDFSAGVPAFRIYEVTTTDASGYTRTDKFVEGLLNATVQTRFASVAGYSQIPLSLKSVSKVANDGIRQLDLTFCIDETGSMSNTLNAVKNASLNFEANLNTELEARGIKKFEAMRVRPIYYRDYGGNTNVNSSGNYNLSGWGYISYNSSNAADKKYMGDKFPMTAANFYKLPDQRTDFQAFTNTQTASGGGDLPEAGLECVSKGMDSPWARKGDTLPDGKKLDDVYSMIVVWTDADTHEPSHARSLLNPTYPPAPPPATPLVLANYMPRNYTDLRSKWDMSAIIPQENKLLVFFGNANTTGWTPLKTWPGFQVGGTLTEGNTQLVKRIADALASKVKSPTLSQ